MAPELTTGDIIFVKGANWFSKIIRAVTFGKVSHVALVYDEYEVFETDGSWLKAKFTPIKEYDNAPIIVFRNCNITRTDQVDIKLACHQYDGTPYSYWDCATNLLTCWLQPQIRKFICGHLSNKFFMKCDELTFRILYEATHDSDFSDYESGNPEEWLEYLYQHPEKYKKIYEA